MQLDRNIFYGDVALDLGYIIYMYGLALDSFIVASRGEDSILD